MKEHPNSIEIQMAALAAAIKKPTVSEINYARLANLAAAMHAKNELLKEFLNIDKEDLEINVTIGNKSYTFGSADYEFDNLCEAIEGIDVDTEWGDCEV